MSTRTKEGAGESPAGLTPSTGDRSRGGFLSDVLVDLGFATRDAVEQAVRAARSPGTTVARVLVETGAITEEQLARATAERHGIDYIDLDGFDVDPAAANLIKPSAAKRYQAVPVGFLGTGLLVAMADPADALGVNDIAVMTKLDVRPAVAARPALDELLEALPLDEWGDDDSPAPVMEAPPAEKQPDERPSAAVFWQEGAGEELPAPEEAREADDTPQLRDDVSSEPDDAHAEAQDAERLREWLGSLTAERDEERERARGAESELRRISADVELRSAELETLRTKLTDAETELVRVRAEAAALGSEAEAARTRSESAEAEAERRAAEAQRLGDELEAADARAEQARQALTELREEVEREREQRSLAERDLREQLSQEETRRGELQERLSEVEGAAIAAERAFEELRLAQRRMRDALGARADLDDSDAG